MGKDRLQGECVATWVRTPVLTKNARLSGVTLSLPTCTDQILLSPQVYLHAPLGTMLPPMKPEGSARLAAVLRRFAALVAVRKFQVGMAGYNPNMQGAAAGLKDEIQKRLGPGVTYEASRICGISSCDAHDKQRGREINSSSLTIDRARDKDFEFLRVTLCNCCFTPPPSPAAGCQSGARLHRPRDAGRGARVRPAEHHGQGGAAGRARRFALAPARPGLRG